jgi:hypothetical protein
MFLFSSTCSTQTAPSRAAALCAAFMPSLATRRRATAVPLPFRVIPFASVHGERIGSGGNHVSMRCNWVNAAALVFFKSHFTSRAWRQRRSSRPLQFLRPLRRPRRAISKIAFCAIFGKLEQSRAAARRLVHDRAAAVRDKMAPAGMGCRTVGASRGGSGATSPQTLRRQYEITHTPADKLKPPVANRGD